MGRIVFRAANGRVIFNNYDDSSIVEANLTDPTYEKIENRSWGESIEETSYIELDPNTPLDNSILRHLPDSPRGRVMN